MSLDPNELIDQIKSHALEYVKQTGKEWVPFKQIAKRIHSIEYTDLVKSAVEMHDDFAFKNGVFRLKSDALQEAISSNVVEETMAEVLDSHGDWQSDLPESFSPMEAVRAYAARQRPILLKATNALNVKTLKRKKVYAISCEPFDEIIPNHSPVELCVKEERTRMGKVLATNMEESIVFVAFDFEISDDWETAWLKVDDSYLLAILADQLSNWDSGNLAFNPLRDASNDRLVSFKGESNELTEHFRTANQPLTSLVWGPPGGGKTYALSKLIARLATDEPGNNTLVVAPSNQAIDVFTEQLVDHLQEINPDLISNRMILRYGYPKRYEVLRRKEILGSDETDLKSIQIEQVAKSIREAKKAKSPIEELVSLQAELLELQEDLKELVAQHVERCRVVLTTTTLAYMPTSPICPIPWSNVVADEVTMVFPATSAFLSKLATNRFVLAGDPLQLGPVYKSNVKPIPPEENVWLKRDLFQFSGSASPTHGKLGVDIDFSRLAAIDVQRRCCDAIWHVVSDLYPSIDSNPSRSRINKISQSSRLLTNELNFVDVQGDSIKFGKSWANPTSADQSINLALAIASSSSRSPTVAVITPYRGQSRLLKKILETQTEREPEFSNYLIEIGTIHQFQGSEADVVIFDISDSPPRKKLGLLLRELAGIRLCNVAFTRARSNLFVVGDRDWIGRKAASAKNRLLERAIGFDNFAPIDFMNEEIAGDLLEEMAISKK